MSMNLGNLNNFLQSMQQASQQNQESQARQQALQAAQVQSAGATAAGNDLGGSPAAAPAPSGPMAAIAALLGHRQQPQTQAPAPQAPAPQQQQAPQGGALPPITLSPQTMAAMPPAAQQGLAAVNADGGQAPKAQDPTLSGTAQNNGDGPPMDAMAEATQNIKAIASSIKASNPGISGATLLAAVHEQIDMVKGVSPLTKATMTAQTTVMMVHQKQQDAQMRHEAAIAAIEAKLKIATDADQVKLLVQQLKDETGITETGMKDTTQLAVGAGHDDAHVKGTKIGANSREIVGAGHDSASRDVGAGHDGARVYGADQNYRGQEARGNPKGSSPTRAPQRPDTSGRTGHPQPSAADVAYLKANKGNASLFDQKFGRGAASAALQ